MKQFKPVIITAAVLLVLAGAVFAVLKLFPMLSDDVGESDRSNVSSSMIKIIDRTSSDVKCVETVTDKGEAFVIDYFVDETGVQTAKLRNAQPLLAYNTDDLVTLSGYVGLLVALEHVSDTPDDALYGFDKPQRTIKVTFNGGDPITLVIGNETPLGTGVYIRRTDRDDVYTVGGNTTTVLMNTPRDYRLITLFDEGVTADSIATASIQRPGEAAISVALKPDSGKKDDPAVQYQSNYALTSPVAADASPDTLNSMFLDKLVAIRASKLIEDMPSNLATYGLDKPVRLSFTTTDGTSAVLLVGGKSEGGGRYVMVDGVPSVIETEADIDFLDISHADIMMQLIWFYNSSDVEAISYKLANGDTHTLQLTTTESKLEGVYDGKTLEANNASNLFLRTIRFTLQGAMTPNQTYSETPACTVTLTLKNGGTTTLALAELNERQYAAIIDGRAPQYYVGVNEVNELLEAFELLKKGEAIPDMF